jgi:hypothetical protein
VATGALLFDADVDLNGNTFADNQVGAYYIDSNGSATGNTFEAGAAGTGVSRFWGAIFDDPPADRLPQPAGRGNLAVRAGNSPSGSRLLGEFSGNLFIGDGSAQSVGLEADAGFGALNVEFTANGNEIRNWGTGVVLFDCGTGTGCTTSDFVLAELRCNRIAGNAVGLASNIDLQVRAENNWWGCSAGPGGATGCNGLDVATGASVDATPWLVMELVPARTDLLVGQTIAVDADLRRNSAGVDVSGTCTLPASTIAFSASIGTLAAASATSTAGVAGNAYTGTTAGTATVTASLDQDQRSVELEVSAATDALFANGFEPGAD